MTIKTISSGQNLLYKEALKLKRTPKARKEGVFLVEGVRGVEEVLKARDWSVPMVFVEADKFERYEKVLLKDYEGRVIVLEGDLINGLSDTMTPQGVIAMVKRRVFDAEDLLSKLVLEKREDKTSKPLFIVMGENLQDPGNVGTILRTADACGADMFVTTRGSCDIYSPKVVRSSMGSLMHLPVCEVPDTVSFISQMKKQGITVLAAHLRGTKMCYEQDLTGAVCLLIGNEGNGLTLEAAEAAGEWLKIPMPGKAESLNAGIAAGILMYETVRQRNLQST